MRRREKNGPDLIEPREMNQACHDFAAILDELRVRAGEFEIAVKANVVQCGPGWAMLHVMFDRNGVRLLEYWPSNGKAWSKRTGEKKTCATGWLALDEAVALSGSAVIPPSYSEQYDSAPKLVPLGLLDLPGRCVKCLEDAPKRFDGLCAGCYSRMLT